MPNGGHFFDVRRGMEVIRVEKDPTELFREELTDGCLASSGRPHHEHDHAARNLGLRLAQRNQRNFRWHAEPDGRTDRAQSAIHVQV